MSDETPGAGQSALPPREDTTSRPTVRVAQVQGGQFILSSQPHTIPPLTQITNGNVATNATLTPGGVTRIISLSPVRNQTSPLRPSLTNQTIVSALTKSRTNSNIRLQLFPGGDISPQGVTTTKSPVKRSLPLNSEKDSYTSKLQRVINHRNVRSKIVKEKFNEHLLECYYLEIGGNILDLYQFAKRPKTQQFLAYVKENAIDPKDNSEEVANLQPVLPVTTPSATCVTSLPGISHSMLPTTVQNAQISTTQCVSTYAVTTPKSSNGNKMKMSVGYPTGINQEQIVEKAKQEAYVVQRISDLQKEGLWSEKRLPKIQEMPRAKAHWDFLLEEMVWLAADFAQERKWKKAAAKKCARMVQKYFQDKALAAQRAERAQEQHIRRIAAFCAKEIKTFWSNVEKLVEYKQNTRLEEKRKKALDQHLSFIVDQTEKYSQLLAEGMNKQGCVEGVLKPSLTIEEQTVPNSYVSSRLNSTGTLSDDDFHPSSISTSSDDEDTIALEEEITKEEETAEVAALQRESEMDLDSFLKELPKDYLVNRNSLIKQENEMSESEVENDDNDVPSKSDGEKETKDEDFVVDSSDEDDEETIQEQEQVEGTQDHQQEIEELKAENELSVEELRKKYTNLPSIPNDEIDVLSENSKSSDEEIEYSSTESFESESENTYSLIHQKNDNFDLEFVLDNAIEFQNEGEEKKTDNNDLINDAAAIAESIQPKGNTLSSTSVVTPVPFLLKLPLREYQHIGLDWLVTMFERKLNGILADEMGLGKTIQTIALLTHLACEKENWGPHLIIVPTSVMLNWEMECKKWCPAFKILTYYGTQKERKLKRTGWTKPNAFHICITSYKLVIQDHQSFRRKKWKYLILDEAQNIKNFKSQRWQLLLNFQTQQRLLLTGTPLQNNLMELWSLMHFLMPHVFQSHREFKEWFSNPVAGMIEGNSEYNDSIIKRLHKVLRPFLLRRLKSEVEKQMPKKYEHIIMCRLSKRQRYLYDDYMSRAKTRETLASGNLLSVINVLMQLRKVCNHPNLFEVRPTISPFHCEGITQHIPSLIYDVFEYNPFNQINLLSLNLCLLEMELYLSAYQCYRMRQYETPKKLIEEMYSEKMIPPDCPPARLSMCVRKVQNIKEAKVEVKEEINSKPNQLLHTAATVKLKVGPGVQLIQQGVPVPHVSIGNQTSGPNINLSSVLKPSEKITVPAGFAQLVQTSTGKHILFTPSSCISTSNLAMGSATVMTSTGQRLTVLSQSVVANTSNPPQTLAKAVVKVQLTSVPSATTSTISTTSPDIKLDDRIPLQTKTVSSKYIEKLYANQSSKRDLDVRWMNKNEEKKYSNEENMETMDSKRNKAALIYRVNSKRCSAVPLYGQDFRNAVKVTTPTKTHWINGRLYSLNVHCSRNVDISECLRNLVFRPDDIMEKLKDTFNRFIVYVPAVHAPEIELQVWHPSPSVYWGRKLTRQRLTNDFSKPTTLLHPIVSAMITQFPHPRLIQYDCGKLQTLDKLLRKLKSEGHRVLIFTQMTKMLDVLEAFLNFHGHIYLRLDGTTKVDQRQILMERFNGDTRIFAFILSTRSGGIGVNLTGADTVIFYDSDWNPTMDAQAQDRCHRIGQTRDVHIYRLVSERTIEENILKKANQKRLLGDLAIEGGNFTTAYFKSSTIQDLFNIDANEEKTVLKTSETQNPNVENQRLSGVVSVPTPAPDDKVAIGALENALAACEDDQDVQAARIAKAEAVADLAEFDETIPLEEQDKEKEPEISKAEQEVENLIKQLTPIERYAMRFIEETEAMWSAEQLAAAEREIEEQKLQWERNRLAAMQEEKERRAKEMEEENELLTFSREDATNQVRHRNKKFLKDCDSLPKKFVKRISTKSSINKNAVNSRTNKRCSSSRTSNRRTNKSKCNQIESQNFNEESIDCKTSPCEDQDSMSNDVVSVGSNSRNENNSDSNDSYTSDLEHHKMSNNHVDHNSPRTRSRGSVAINLWTLDVSPILPGVKPVRSNMQTVVGRRLKSDTDLNDSSKSLRKIELDKKRRKYERNRKDDINCIKTETTMKRIKKRNGNKDIKLQENVDLSTINSEDEKLDNNEINDPKCKTEKDCKMKVDNEKLLESLSDAIEEIENSSSKKQIKTSVSVQCNSNSVEVNKTLKIILTDVITNKQFEKYFNSKDCDGVIENHSDFDSINCNYSDNSSAASFNDVRNHEIVDTSKKLEVQNVEENVQDIKKTVATNKFRLKSPETKKVVKRVRIVSKINKTVDPKNNTLDNWLIKHPKNEVEKRTKLKDSSINLVENKGVSEEVRTKNCNLLEISCETNHLEK